MDLFTLVGKIAIDCTEAETKIDSLLAKAGQLNTALGGTSGTTTPSTTTSQGATSQTTQNGTTTEQVATGTALGNFFSGIVRLAGGWAIDYMKDYTGSGLDYIKTREEDVAALKSLYGLTDDEALGFYGKLEDVAVNTMLNMDSLGNAAVKFANVGYTQDEVLEAVNVLADASLGSNARFERLVKATSDVESYVKLRAQERNQYAEADVPIIKLLADYYGMEGGVKENAGMLADMQEHGDISSDDVWNAIIKATEPGGQYYEASENMMNTLVGQEERLAELKEISAGKFVEKSGFGSLYEWWLKMRSEMYEKDIGFFNDPTSTPEMQKVMDIVDTFTAPTPTYNDLVNPDEAYGPPTPEGWTPGNSISKLETILTRMEEVLNPETFKAAAKEGSAEGVANGLSGVTITTGSVTLNDGVLVGRLAPKLNLALGQMTAREARG